MRFEFLQLRLDVSGTLLVYIAMLRFSSFFIIYCLFFFSSYTTKTTRKAFIGHFTYTRF